MLQRLSNFSLLGWLPKLQTTADKTTDRQVQRLSVFCSKNNRSIIIDKNKRRAYYKAIEMSKQEHLLQLDNKNLKL